MLRYICLYTLLFFQLFFFSQVHSQVLRHSFDESGQTYIQASIRGQFWTRYIQMNPRTTINNEFVDEAFDISIRRIRMGFLAQVTPNLMVYALFGDNNINARSEKSIEFKVLDFNVEYSFSEQCAVGIGETGWTGLSRWNVRSSRTMMSLDAPLFAMLTVGKNDNLGRSLGIWTKGQIGKFDYVVALKQPADYGVEARDGVVDYALNQERLSTSAYVKYEFFDNESNKTAYSGGAGTYLGAKKILNFGSGFLFQPKMTSSLVNSETQYYDFKNWAAEFFYDAPRKRKNAQSITAYLGFFKTYFGPEYIRNLGANDYTATGSAFNGSGNDFPMMGTGQTLFMQLGYLWQTKLSFRDRSIGIQPNVAWQSSSFDALAQQMNTFDFGINGYFDGHSNKLSLNYQQRPIYEEEGDLGLVVTDHKGMWVLQYQIEIN
ncbi:MAG: hypothetical protein ACI92W_000208 [Paraglaciecola sp.]|jgi:hypothetical protein